MKIILLALLIMTNSIASDKTAESMVPFGKILEVSGREYVLKTRTGSKISIEFFLDGQFQEAKGKELNRGDELEPGDGLLSLSTVAQLLRKEGHHPEGIWELERDPIYGWVYEFSVAVVDARTGKILRSFSQKDPHP